METINKDDWRWTVIISHCSIGHRAQYAHGKDWNSGELSQQPIFQMLTFSDLHRKMCSKAIRVLSSQD